MGTHPPTNPAIRVRFSEKPNAYWWKRIFTRVAIKRATPFQNLTQYFVKTEHAIYWRKSRFSLTLWVKGKRSPNKLALWRLTDVLIYSTLQRYTQHCNLQHYKLFLLSKTCFAQFFCPIFWQNHVQTATVPSLGKTIFFKEQAIWFSLSDTLQGNWSLLYTLCHQIQIFVTFCNLIK